MPEMNVGKAMGIFKQLDSDKYTDKEKVHAIYLVMNMATHMSITKTEMIEAIKWLWHRFYEFVDEKDGEKNV